MMHNKMCKAATVKAKTLGNHQQIMKAHAIEHKRTPSKNVVLLGSGESIELTLKKTKNQKRTSPVASTNPEQKAEKKRSMATGESPQNWGAVFRQNSMHTAKELSSKHSKDGETKKNINAKKSKTTVKQPKSEEKHVNPCCSSVLVRDSAVQCSETYNSNILAEFNSTHMLNLIKQLQDLVKRKDTGVCEIFTELEQILQKISDLETKAKVSPLKEPSKKIKEKTVSYELTLEREKLECEILQRDARLKEIDQKYSELTFHAKTLKQQLEEITREKNDMISVVTGLRRQNENNERLITNLKIDLNKQTELIRQNDVDSKCLTMEIEKLSALVSFKNSQIIGYHNAVKELQNQIVKQLKVQSSTSPDVLSLIHTGHACSSPNSSLSDDFNKSWQDLSDISSVDSIPEEQALKKDAPVKDFELFSLLDGESSHTILDQNEVMNDKGSMPNNNEHNAVPYQNVDANDVTAKKSLRHSSKKGQNKENDTHKMKKFTRLKEKQNDNTKNLFLNASKALESVISIKPTVSDMRKQGDMQNRKPVNVPSPLRDCPHPDWSDSSLPSISSVSNMDMVPSNDV